MTIGLNLLTNPTSSALVQNSVFQVMSEGSLKAVGRPVFTLLDKNATPEARKYSATKEFIYQVLCLAFYFSVVSFAKQGAYKALHKMFKGSEGFEPSTLKGTFKEQWQNLFRKGSEKVKYGLEGALDRAKKGNPDKIKDAVTGEQRPIDYTIVKGAIEAASILSSGIILTILAPQIVTRVLHPIMSTIDKHSAKNKAAQQVNNGDTFVKSNETKVG